MFDAAPLHKLRFFPLALIRKAQNHNSHGLVSRIQESRAPVAQARLGHLKLVPAAVTRVALRRIAPRQAGTPAANLSWRMAVPGMLTPRWWASLASQLPLPRRKRRGN